MQYQTTNVHAGRSSSHRNEIIVVLLDDIAKIMQATTYIHVLLGVNGILILICFCLSCGAVTNSATAVNDTFCTADY